MAEKRKMKGERSDSLGENDDIRNLESIFTGEEDSMDDFQESSVQYAQSHFPGFVKSSQIAANSSSGHRRVTDDEPCEEKHESDASDRPFSRKRKRHMPVEECFAYSQSREGASSLTNPSSACKGVSDYKTARYLNPVQRGNKLKNETGVDGTKGSDSIDGSSFHGDSSSGFVSAANMYNIAPKIDQFANYGTKSSSVSRTGNAPLSHPGRSKKLGPPPRNQNSILDYMKPSTSEAGSEPSTPTKSSQPSQSSSCFITTSQGNSSLKNKSPSLLYSPIKQISSNSTIYISDDSLSSSQSSQPCSQPSTTSFKDNPVVKQLFEAQKNPVQLKPKKGKGKSKSSSSFFKTLNKPVASTRRASPSSYLENDSFDLNAAFASDFEDSDRASPAPSQYKDKYGLLGTGANPSQNDTGINYFEQLPPEVVENIFCQLPLLDLCLNSNRVCLTWNEIISSDKFVPWKKLYHKLKKDVDDCRQIVQDMLRENGMMFPSMYLIGLIRYMKNFKPVTAGNMIQSLQKHNKFHWAKALMEERLEDCYLHGDPNPWSLICVLVIISHSVDDIQELIRCLTTASSQCTSLEIIECLYCIATFLYAFKLAKNADVWNGMHYRLFYALYLFENSSSSSCSDLQSAVSGAKGQQSLIKYSIPTEGVRLTHEQLRIVKHKTEPGEVIKIVAFAGTGKTTTLVRYTQLRPDKNFILVVYNKSVAEYAKKKFPKNVTCRTGHSLAFQDVGRRYAAAKKLKNLKVYTLTQELRPRKGENLFIMAKFVLDTIEHFVSSKDPFITTAHVPSEKLNEKTGLKEQIDQTSKMHYAEDAEYIWNRMKDLRDNKVPMTHDGYLKLYQLKRPVLSQYDCILIDEAQDLTPAITDILLSQPQSKILVGDPHQQIYSFRGAINAMNQIRADTIFYLTQSFRFGPQIAQVAASCLEIVKQVKQKTLVGSGEPGSITGEQVGQLAIICRCNYTLFNEAVKKCCYSETNYKVAFVGGTDGFGFPMIQDIYTLMLSEADRVKERRVIENKLIKGFANLGALEQYATKTMDGELLGKIKIVKAYHHNLPAVIHKILSKTIRDTAVADIVFSTAHKAKGLEFSTVRVTDDFSVGQHAAMMLQVDFPHLALHVPLAIRDPNSDEGNLLYVAVTRAKHALQMTPTIANVLRQSGEKFDYPVLSKELEKQGTTFRCRETDAEFKPNALTLQKKAVKLGDGQEMHGGLFSPQILTEDGGSFSKLLGVKS